MKFSKINPGADAQAYGTEPSWTNQAEMTNLRSEEIRALNWYNYFCDSKQAKTFVVEYMASIDRPKEEISLVASSDASIPVQLGWVARMMCMGYEPSESFKNFFVKEFKSIVETAKKTKKPKAPVAVATNTAEPIDIRLLTGLGKIDSTEFAIFLNVLLSLILLTNPPKPSPSVKTILVSIPVLMN